MKYRAILTGISDLERPVQNFSESRVVINQWAEKILKDYPAGAVEVYMVSEVLLERKWKAKDRIETAKAETDAARVSGEKA